MSAAPAQPPARWPEITATTLLVLGCILAPLALIAVWAERQVLDADRYVATVSVLSADPTIQDAAATAITNALFTGVDVRAQVASLLPGQQGLLAGPITGTLAEYTHGIVVSVIASERGQRLWIEANRRAHPRLVTALTGEGGVLLRLEEGRVVLDLVPILDEARTRLREQGVTLFDRLPADRTRTAELVIVDSAELARVNRVTDRLITLSAVLPLLAAGALLGSIAVAPWRDRAVLRLGIGAALAMAILLALLAIGRALYLNTLDAGQGRDVAAVVLDTVLESLRRAGRVGILLGLVVAAAGFLLQNRQARPSADLLNWVGAHRRGVSAGILAVACVALAIWDRPSLGAVVTFGSATTALLAFVLLTGRGQPAAPTAG